MTFRTVTLTAVAALSLGMAAHAQETRTITVPLAEPGATAPALDGPGTTVIVKPDGTTSVETTGAEPATAADDQAAAAPAPEAAAPAAEAAAPAAEAAAPAAEAAAPAAEAAAPAAEAAAPAAEAAAPAAEAAAPAAEAAAPAAEAAAPAAEAAAPAAEAAAPAAEAEAPAAEAEAPAAEAEAPAAEAAAPAADAEAPAAEAEAPAAEAAAPAAEAEAPADEAEAPAAEAAAPAAEEPAPAPHEQHVQDVAFSFEGPFGTFDQFQLQRGLQIYTEVCSSCHGMKQVPLRSLGDESGPGLPEDQVRAYAKEMTIVDAETGEDRARLPTDHFPTVSGEGMGPDLSLMAKARAGFHGPYGTGINQLIHGIGGPEYIHAILTSYTGETKDEAGATFYENTAFPGGWIGMPPPLADDQVEFADGSPTDLDSEAKDIAAFLMWTAEPKMMARKQVGLVSVIFLIVLSALLYLTNKRLWWPLKHRRDLTGDKR